MLRPAMIEACNPSPCPSPHGRGDACTTVATAFPLPEGEGQGEGRFPQFVTPADIKFAPERLRGNDAAANLAPVIDANRFAGVIN